MDQMVKEAPNITTQLLAIWGAILSTFLGGVELIKFYYEGVRIKVEVRSGFRAIPKDTIYGDKDFILIIVSNAGKATTTITHAWLMTSSKTRIICPECFKRGPQKLAEGDYTQYMVPEEEMLKQYGMKPRDYIACVSDAVGRKFYSHCLPVRWFKRARMKLFTKIKS